jgi:hypothetical protein
MREAVVGRDGGVVKAGHVASRLNQVITDMNGKLQGRGFLFTKNFTHRHQRHSAGHAYVNLVCGSQVSQMTHEGEGEEGASRLGDKEDISRRKTKLIYEV